MTIALMLVLFAFSNNTQIKDNAHESAYRFTEFPPINEEDWQRYLDVLYLIKQEGVDSFITITEDGVLEIRVSRNCNKKNNGITVKSIDTKLDAKDPIWKQVKKSFPDIIIDFSPNKAYIIGLKDRTEQCELFLTQFELASTSSCSDCTHCKKDDLASMEMHKRRSNKRNLFIDSRLPLIFSKKKCVRPKKRLKVIGKFHYLEKNYAFVP